MIDPVEFLKFLKERRSIRTYLDKDISDKEIEMILELEDGLQVRLINNHGNL